MHFHLNHDVILAIVLKTVKVINIIRIHRDCFVFNLAMTLSDHMYKIGRLNMEIDLAQKHSIKCKMQIKWFIITR